ncbi:MAG: hypothetical protein ACI4NM_12135 [Bullifex sp.]
MKYHTTFSTAVISFLILAVFVFVSVFAVSELRIDSPGYLVLSLLEDRISLPEDVYFSYSSIDRIMSSSVTVNSLRFDTPSFTAEADKLTVYSNPFVLLKKIVTGHGRIEADVSDVRITLKSSGETGLNLDLSPENILSDISLPDDGNDFLSGSVLRKLSYSFNAYNLSVMTESFSAGGLKCNLQIDEDLSFRSFVAEIPSFSYKGAAASALAFKAGHDGKLYTLALSGDTISCDTDEFSLSVEQPRISMEFPSFSSLDPYELPIKVSSGKLELSIGDVRTSAGLLSFETADGVMYWNIGSVSASYGSYSLFSDPLSGIFDYTSEDGAKFSLRLSDYIILQRDGQEIAKASLVSADATYLTALTLSAEAETLSVSTLEEYTSDAVSAASLEGISFSLQQSSTETYADASLSVTVNSANSLLDGASADIKGNVYLQGGKPEEFSVYIDSLKTNALPEALRAALNLNNGVYSGQVQYSDTLSISGTYSDTYSGDLTLSGFRADSLNSVIDRYLPTVKRYIGNDTLMNGYMRILSDRQGKGSLYSSIALDGVHFNDNVFGLASGLSASVTDKGIDDIKLTVTSELVRFSYNGSVSYSTFLPEGRFAVSLTKTGKELFSLSIIPGEREYEFSARLLERSQGYLKGKINWARKDIVQALGEVRSNASIYPFDLSIDLSAGRADLLSDNLLLTADFSDQLDIYLSFDSFPLPVKDLSVKPITIDGSMSYCFNFAEQISLMTITGLAVRNIRYIPSNPEIIINGSYSDMVLNLDSISWRDGVSELNGTLVLPISESRLAFTLGNAEERLNVSFLREEGMYTGIVTVKSLALDRFGFSNARLNAALIGKGANSGDFDFSGELSVTPSGDAGQFSLSGKINLNDRSVRLHDMDFTFGPLSVKSSETGYSIDSGVLSGAMSLNLTKANNDRDYPVTSSLSFTIPVGTYSSVTDAFFSSLDRFRNEFSVDLKIDGINIDDFVKVGQRDLSVRFEKDRGFTLSGSLAEGCFNTSSMMTDIKLDLMPVASLSVSGSADPQKLDLDLRNVVFNLGSINFSFPFPIIWFSDTSFVEGDLKLFGTLTDTHLYGNLFTKGFDMEVWWLQKSVLHLSDLHFSMIDNYLYCPKSPVLIIDKEEGPVKCVDVDLEAQLSSSNIVDFFGLNVWIDRGQDVFVRIPIESQNMQIDADVYGHFSYYTDLIKNYLGGEIKSDSGVFSYGMDPLPHWWKSTMLVNNDFDVTLGENMKFLFPLSADPILVAYMKDNSHFRFTYDNQEGSIGLDGSLDFRSGEIYYFEKNFYITEGSLRFDNTTARRLSPVLDLRARLRDYDAEGNKVDIYLVLRNSTLTDLNPYFESTPKKELNEIMSILGDAILPASSYGEFNLSSVASLVTSGVDVMARMGLIGSSSSVDLINSIRNSLGLDMFSLRTNLIENLLLDTIFSSTGQTISPIARYLDKTSIYIGKYLSENFFLQGMIHLSALDSSKDISKYTTILADDLMFDVEISLEWQNPLGTVSFFTKPRNLSLHNLFDSFGFSFSKTIVF